MKPSGIEWIGDIPDDWEVRRGKCSAPLLVNVKLGEYFCYLVEC